ncbi:MAG: tetratricopeptide repeat protein [Gemmatimonadota bacterium]
MSKPEKRRRIPYWVTYGLTAGTLLAVTAALVLVVLPARFVLVADLRESGVSFPTTADALAFPMATRDSLIQPPPTPPTPAEPEPGPAELLWAEIDPLLADQRYRAAIESMDRYLLEHPGDVSVQRERARTLVLADEPEAAREAFEALVRRTDAPVDRLALARLLRDLGEVDEAGALYRELIAERPADLELQHEVARFYMWAGRYPEAEAILRGLVARVPDAGAYRLDLARVLYWSDRPAEARVVLAGIPEDAAEAAEARALDEELAALLRPPPEPEPEPQTLVDRARAAAADEDLEAAAALYARAVAETPTDQALALEHIDFLQYRLEDFEATILAIQSYEARFGADPDLSYRLAELYVWTGKEHEARLVLERLVRDHPDRADAWGLLGDVLRYADERAAARKAYERALALEPNEPHAEAGVPELDRLRALTISAREPIGIGPLVSLFSDSDDFLKLDLGASAGWIGSSAAVDLTAGYRRLEGLDLAGLDTSDNGFFGGVQGSYWWSEASLRAALRLGVDHLERLGTEPTVGLSLEKFGATGSSLSLHYDHRPAYHLTATLESAVAEVAADHVQVQGTTPLGDDWALAGSADLALLDGGGITNSRFGGAVTISRRLGRLFRAEFGTRLLGFSDPAPILGRRLYWDPSLFWSNTAGVSLNWAPEQGLGYRARLIGGAAWSDERDLPEARWVPQFGVDAGISWLSERTALDLGAFYRRSREDEYSSYGLNLTLRVRP